MTQTDPQRTNSCHYEKRQGKTSQGDEQLLEKKDKETPIEIVVTMEQEQMTNKENL